MILFFEIILAVLIVVVAGWILFVYFFTWQLAATFLKGEAPFVPAKAGILPKIAEAMELKENSILYDLGCGDARVLVACHKSQPQAQYVGFEKNIIPYLWARFRVWATGLSKNIRVCQKDFFEADLSGATHIFCYLVPKQMEKLGPKLEKEIENGKKVLSLRFGIPNVAPRKKILLEKENLYIYEKLAKS